eukprot:TRINITY_DN27768_c0_g1_i1.p1 TRINITY_DN27768_c0_g1~~TRINITY_DN27768_c0_g1_i1.p1  ORF type:complete len:422 (+),score=107.71 TRINITY_DN27768_c0_g1_i1:33-1268(+)
MSSDDPETKEVESANQSDTSPSKWARQPVYTVRNTFIDLAPTAEEAPNFALFGTWPCRAEVHRRSEQVDEEDAPKSSADEPELEEGEVSDFFNTGQLSGFDFKDLRERERQREREDGELTDDDSNVDDDPDPAGSPDPADGRHASREAQDGPRIASLGSADHGRGSCRPCAWLYKSAEGCRHGQNCEYCHLCPPGELKRRKREKLVMRAIQAKSRHQQEKQEKTPQAWPKGPPPKPPPNQWAPMPEEGSFEPPPPPPFEVSAAVLSATLGPEISSREASGTPTLAAIGAAAVSAALAIAAASGTSPPPPPPEAVPVLEPCYVNVSGLRCSSATSSVTAATPASPPRATSAGSSIGSALHATGACKPCAWLHKDVAGCKHGANCFYCHLCPPGEVKRRKFQKAKVLRAVRNQ